jgi:hypothetical protein
MALSPRLNTGGEIFRQSPPPGTCHNRELRNQGESERIQSSLLAGHFIIKEAMDVVGDVIQAILYREVT